MNAQMREMLNRLEGDIAATVLNETGVKVEVMCAGLDKWIISGTDDTQTRTAAAWLVDNTVMGLEYIGRDEVEGETVCFMWSKRQ